ncbi:kin of IRRE-like protein 2 isoform X2 [Aplysia californica]|uniref:Kin of IRRE-like protein 2 isoform X2 n=1 Tax=Aplysia californica TaxID=6500 RepID=A0ABM1VVR8_APLCA|nr:kin of IRRE-like protein 2 isoform X2 [Aplysia californica]
MAEHGVSPHGMHALWLLCLLLPLTPALADTDPSPDYKSSLPRDPRPQMKLPVDDFPLLAGNKARVKGGFRPPLPLETTTRLPEFVPDGPRPYIPDPSFMPGDVDIAVHQGDVAVLPCTVQNLGTKEVSWQKVGGDHFLSIGTHVWVQDQNLKVAHQNWPAGVSDWNLVFREARVEDSGMYECQIIATEKMSWRVKLSVIEKPPHNPVISIEGQEFVESGQTVYLRCNTTEGDRIPDDVDWFKNGDKIDQSTYPNVVITKYRMEETMSLVSELLIMSGHNRDSGTYICRSSSELIASVEVNVLVANSPNVKRGTGTSNTQTGSSPRGENSAMYLPLFLSNPFIFSVALMTHLIIRHLIT